MSRSKKHTPVTGVTTAESVRPYTRERAGKERSRQRALLHEISKLVDTEDDLVYKAEVELSPWNEWDSPRDGKYYYTKNHIRAYAKTGRQYRRLFGK